jgi:erythromycin esterase-like protein
MADLMSGDPILDWARSAGRPLGRRWSEDADALALLDPWLTGADLVFLGETDHFIHEKSDFRLLACRWLLSRGWRSFAEELAWSDGMRVRAYLNGGDDAVLQRLSLFGWKADLRADRDDRPTGVFRPAFDLYPTALMTAEQGRFYRGLHAAAARAALAYRGFDIDGAPGGGYADIAGWLSPQADGPLTRAFLARLARIPGESIAQESRRLTALVPLARSLAAEVGAAAADEVDAALRALAESLVYVDITYAAATYEATAPGMAYREGCMKRRWADLRRLDAGAPTVVMGHALHLAKDDRLLGKAVGVGPGGGLECSIGHHLAQELGLKAVSIWLVHGAGEDSQPFPGLPRALAYPAASLNNRLMSLGQPWLVPIAGAPPGLFDAPLGVGHMYNAVQPVTLAGQVDALVFLPRVTPMRLSPPTRPPSRAG